MTFIYVYYVQRCVVHRPLTVCLGGKAGRLVLICAKSGVLYLASRNLQVCALPVMRVKREAWPERQTEQAKPK